MTLIERVHQTIARHRLLSEDDRILVAVSGGIDSVALAAVLRHLQPAYRWTLFLGHVDHQLRSASATDAEHVRALGRRWELPVFVERVDVAAEHRRQGGSLEETARQWRYAALLRMARACHAQVVAVAHTRDDQAETVLMHLLRGTGVAGMTGMPFARTLDERRVVRPLLECWRRDVERYVRAEGLPFVEDATNRDRQFFRNRVRHALLPLLEREYNPQIKELLIQWMTMSEAAYAFVQEQAAKQFRRHAQIDPAGVRLPLPVLRRWPLALQQEVVRQAVAAVKGDLRLLGFQHWEELASLMLERPTRSVVNLPGGVRAVKAEKHLEIARVLATVESVTYNQPVVATKG